MKLSPTSSLIFSQLLAAFSYYGTETLLVLYLVHEFHFSENQSLAVYGAFVSLIFTMPTLAGIISDRFIGMQRGFIFGAILAILANVLLLIKIPFLFSLGLSFLIIGVGFMKSGSLSLMGSMHQKGSAEKEKGFTLLYVSTNLGATAGPLCYGLAVYYFGWNKGFLISGIGFTLALILSLLQRSYFPIEKKQHRYRLRIYIGVIVAGFLLSLPFYKINMIDPVIILLFAISLIYLKVKTIRQPEPQRKSLLILLTLSFFGIFYYLAGMQMGSSMTVFIQNEINAGKIHFQLPASVFASFYTLFVVLFAPFVQMFWRRTKSKGNLIAIPHKLALGITLGAISLFCFAIASLLAAPLTLIILGIAALSLGELVLTPAIYTAMSDYAPEGMKSSMMGCWLLFVAMGGYLSSVLSRLTHDLAVYFGNQAQCFVFLINAGVVLSGAIVLLLITSKLRLK